MDIVRSGPGHPAADFNRGLQCCDAATGFPQILAAAEKGCARAQFLVGFAHQTGEGAPLDYRLAACWYQRAAGAGDAHAIANLAVMSLLGQGTPIDDLDAYTWTQSAVGLGEDWLRPALKVLEYRLSGRRSADEQSVLEALAPRKPVFVPCTSPECDLSRCPNA